MGEVEDGIVTECWMGCRSRVPGKFRARRGDGGGCRIRTRCSVRGGLRGRGKGGRGTVLYHGLCLKCRGCTWRVCVLVVCVPMCGVVGVCVKWAEWERGLPKCHF